MHTNNLDFFFFAFVFPFFLFGNRSKVVGGGGDGVALSTYGA
jgi:hypothetical protein